MLHACLTGSSSLDLAQIALVPRDSQEFEDLPSAAAGRRRRGLGARAPRHYPPLPGTTPPPFARSRDPSCTEPGAAGTGGRLSIDARMKQLNWLDSAAEEARRQSLAATAAESAAAAAATAAATGAADASAAAVAPPPSSEGVGAVARAAAVDAALAALLQKPRRPRLLVAALRARRRRPHHRTAAPPSAASRKLRALIRKAPSLGKAKRRSNSVDVARALTAGDGDGGGGGGGSVRALALRADDWLELDGARWWEITLPRGTDGAAVVLRSWTRDEVERWAEALQATLAALRGPSAPAAARRPAAAAAAADPRRSSVLPARQMWGDQASGRIPVSELGAILDEGDVILFSGRQLGETCQQRLMGIELPSASSCARSTACGTAGELSVAPGGSRRRRPLPPASASMC